MVHAIHRVTGFSVVGPYTTSVAFSDGTEQRIDFEPVLHDAPFGPLRDLATCNQVTLDPEAATLQKERHSGAHVGGAAGE